MKEPKMEIEIVVQDPNGHTYIADHSFVECPNEEDIKDMFDVDGSLVIVSIDSKEMFSVLI